MSHKQISSNTDILLIGAGIMSATLGTLLHELDPSMKMIVLEKLDRIAAESSDAWNNAGTGHSAFCELNYTPEDANGNVDIHKALHITESFELSRQFWSYLVENGKLKDTSFIHSIPHMSFVWGDENVAYLRKRYEAMKTHHFYSKMLFSDDHEQLKAWMPLVMNGRDAAQPAAATRIDIGADVNFGILTRGLFQYLQAQDNVDVLLEHKVSDIERLEDGRWLVTVKNAHTAHHEHIAARFVFIGAGGGALTLLEKSGIPESEGYGGFPVSGQWLKCTNRSIIDQHHAKVYGKASVGAPPMSVPHLDTRVIDGKNELLFGPYAGFSTKFLKEGSYLDLPRSLTWDNILPMIDAGLHNLSLTKYLIGQVLQSDDDRLHELKQYFPAAQKEDWQLEVAGQRVQVIKKDEKDGGVLEFGTEVVSASDGTLSALLGASPGASTSVAIMLQLLNKCFSGHMCTDEWESKLKKMIPSYGQVLAENEQLCSELRAQTAQILGLVN